MKSKSFDLSKAQQTYILRGPLPKEPMNNEEEIYKRLQIIYRHSGVGGNVHIIADDTNCDEESLDYCLEALNENYHKQSEEAQRASKEFIELLRPYSEEERERIIDTWQDFPSGHPFAP